MATSGSSDFTVTTNDITTGALDRINVPGLGQDVPPEYTAKARTELNLMVKAWMSDDGPNLWTYQYLTVYLNIGQRKYTFGSSGDHITATPYSTTTGAALAIAGTSMTVSSITNMTTGDNIGIEMSDGVLHWTTINGTPTGTTVVLTTGPTVAVSSGARVHFYTNKANRPQRIISARRRQLSSNTDTPLTIIARAQYDDLSTKFGSTESGSDGTISQLYYDPQLTSDMYVWPPSSVETQVLELTVQRLIEDFDGASDNPDYPAEWFDALVWGLAARLAVIFGVNKEVYARVKLEAESSKYKVLAHDRELDASVFLEPNYRW